MPEIASTVRLVLTTASNSEEGRRIARALVEERLAACATLIPAVESIYRWKGQIETSAEVMLLVKTGAAQLPALEKRLHELHSYETPEFLVLQIEAGSSAYLHWMRENLGAPGTSSPAR